MSDAATEAVWTVVANMTREVRGSPEDGPRRGTPMFGAGARLYLGEGYWGMGESTHVIGLHRGSKRLVNCVVRLALLTDVRAKLEYAPGRIAALRRLNARIFADRAAAEAEARHVEGWILGNLARRGDGMPAPESPRP